MIVPRRRMPGPTGSNPGIAVTSQHPAPASRPGRILVVDDDPDLRNLLFHLLCGAGYDVCCASDGETGWSTLIASRFDLVITDHTMPRLSGLNLLRRLRAGNLTVPVILLSGSMPWFEPDLLSLLSPGVAIEKPFTIVTLFHEIRSLLPASMHTGPEIRLAAQTHRSSIGNPKR